MLTLDSTRAPAPAAPSIGVVRPRSPSQPVATEEQRLRRPQHQCAGRRAAQGAEFAGIRGRAGHPAAQWKLGRMYADGDGVPRDDVKAFDYFSRIADDHADDTPGTPQARFVANAFVALGCYYLDGIPNSKIKADPDEARNLFFYAASYFGDPDAQYHLARTMLDGIGGPRIRSRRSSGSACRPPRAIIRRRPCSADAVQGLGRAAAGGARPDVADARPRQRGPRRSLDRRICRTPRSSRRATTSAPWRSSISRNACTRGAGSPAAVAVERGGYAGCTSSSIHTGTWSDGFSQRAHVLVDARRRRAGRRPAATAAGGRCGCRCSSARRRPGSPRTCRGRERRWWPGSHR